jgi:serine/threonine protein kinase
MAKELSFDSNKANTLLPGTLFTILIMIFYFDLYILFSSYMAPEVISAKFVSLFNFIYFFFFFFSDKYDASADIWSMGVVMYHVCPDFIY